MKQVRLVQANTLTELETSINEELKRLSSIDGINILGTNIVQSGASFGALIEYEQKEKIKLFEQELHESINDNNILN